MGATLALGLFVHVLGYQIGIGTAPMPDWIPRELAATLVANLGIVLWTSVILVVFLDTLPARARRRAAGSMALAARKLEERGLPVPDELAGVDVGRRVSRHGPRPIRRSRAYSNDSQRSSGCCPRNE